MENTQLQSDLPPCSFSKHICKYCCDVDNPANNYDEFDDESGTEYEFEEKGYRTINEKLVCSNCLVLFPKGGIDEEIISCISSDNRKINRFKLQKSFTYLASQTLWSPDSSRVKNWMEEKTRAHGMK